MWHNNSTKEDSKNTAEEKELHTQEASTPWASWYIMSLTWNANSSQRLKHRPPQLNQVPWETQIKMPDAITGKTYLCQDIWEVCHESHYCNFTICGVSTLHRKKILVIKWSNTNELVKKQEVSHLKPQWWKISLTNQCTENWQKMTHRAKYSVLMMYALKSPVCTTYWTQTWGTFTCRTETSYCHSHHPCKFMLRRMATRAVINVLFSVSQQF